MIISAEESRATVSPVPIPQLGGDQEVFSAQFAPGLVCYIVEMNPEVKLAVGTDKRKTGLENTLLQKECEGMLRLEKTRFPRLDVQLLILSELKYARDRVVPTDCLDCVRPRKRR